MAERIRANQYQKKMSEERERTEERISSLQNQIEAQQLMISKLEETEKLLRQKNSHLEHQLRLVTSCKFSYFNYILFQKSIGCQIIKLIKIENRKFYEQVCMSMSCHICL